VDERGGPTALRHAPRPRRDHAPLQEGRTTALGDLANRPLRRRRHDGPCAALDRRPRLLGPRTPALLATHGIGRAAFGVALLIAPAAAGRMLAGNGATTPDAQAFLHGIGARDLGIGLGMLGALRTRRSTHGRLIAGVLADTGDAAGIARAWRYLDPDKRTPRTGIRRRSRSGRSHAARRDGQDLTRRRMPVHDRRAVR